MNWSHAIGTRIVKRGGSDALRRRIQFCQLLVEVIAVFVFVVWFWLLITGKGNAMTRRELPATDFWFAPSATLTSTSSCQCD
jgi:hypothetical protein